MVPDKAMSSLLSLTLKLVIAVGSQSGIEPAFEDFVLSKRGSEM